jgi:hypothetical protein
MHMGVEDLAGQLERADIDTQSGNASQGMNAHSVIIISACYTSAVEVLHLLAEAGYPAFPTLLLPPTLSQCSTACTKQLIFSAACAAFACSVMFVLSASAPSW